MIISAHEARRIAVEALVDPRTVYQYVDGRSMKSLTSIRIEKALHGLKRTDLIEARRRAAK